MYYTKYVSMVAALHRHPEYAGIDTVVETGTATGDFAMTLRNLFDHVHTIELSDRLFAEVGKNFRDSKVHFHHGDSAIVVPELSVEINRPCIWYLDAHYCKQYEGRAAGQKMFPLWQELAAIRARPYAEIVIVDDVHNFGRFRGENWGNWEDVSETTICEALDQSRTFDAYFAKREFVVYRKGAEKCQQAE